MNNVVHIKASSIFLSSGVSVPDSLRWLRRAATLTLIVVNFTIAMWLK